MGVESRGQGNTRSTQNNMKSMVEEESKASDEISHRRWDWIGHLSPNKEKEVEVAQTPKKIKDQSKI